MFGDYNASARDAEKGDSAINQGENTVASHHEEVKVGN